MGLCENPFYNALAARPRRAANANREKRGVNRSFLGINGRE